MSRRKQPLPPHLDQNRREFLWKGACAALSATGIVNTIWDLRMVNAAAAASLPTRTPARPGVGASPGATPAANPGYKALVCLFLFGGNDGNNVLIPTDAATYAQYSSARGTLAVPSASVAALNPLNNTDGHTYGLHPSCQPLADLFNGGKAAVLRNVGTLLAPLTRAQYLNHSVATPPQLFSHNDQQIEWQTGIEDQAPKTGWGGRSADLLYSMNTNNTVSMNISLAGANTIEVGNVINEYNVSSSGAIALNVPTSGTSGAQLQALKDLLALNHTNLYESAFASQMNTAITDAATLNADIAPTASAGYWTTAFPTSSLGNQLKMIARLIQAAPALGHQRQIFFASIGGFDLHSGEGAASGAHANLLADLSKSMNALYQATVQMGVSTQVTQFTASDFCRTFPINSGAGADHAWGNHQFIVGGGVNGQTLYGTFPTLLVGGPDDTSTGRWIPTTAVEQYSATLAKWFGVSPTNINTVFPYVRRFATPDLGFMA